MVRGDSGGDKNRGAVLALGLRFRKFREGDEDEDALAPPPPPPADGPEEGATGGRWSQNLFLYTRVLAGLELLKGLFHWSQLLGVGYGVDGFSSESNAWQGATIYFAIVDLVAAVGLWMAPSWGAVMWLFAAASQLGVFLVMPEVLERLWFVLVYELCALGVYAYLAIRANYEKTD
jgi:hypothetical protein